ncbi:Asp/Glu racemase [Apodospora peruviana]|uniref:Asp/Glu racemase n=1 Tax=Apodospora peruviana TaxID=516989 RepID=A0AAE0M7C6_9PEZI|nr:Asp/Glu racemase [Apodospora peruviana]
MKTIGILGGMSAASTQTHYRELCNMTPLQVAGEWEKAGVILNQEAKALERGGADFIVLSTNTMHKLADQMMQVVSIPLLHTADVTAAPIKQQGLHSPGLMATAFTMEQSFYTDRLAATGLVPMIPNASDTTLVHCDAALTMALG